MNASKRGFKSFQSKASVQRLFSMRAIDFHDEVIK